MRYLCIDLGEKRTGIATGDDVTRTVSPIAVLRLPHGPVLAAALRALIREHEPHGIVIGLPLNMDGSENESTRRVRAFGEELAASTGLPVHYQDERLTSYAADQKMARTGKTHKQKKLLRDALAAAEILRDFFERNETTDEHG